MFRKSFSKVFQQLLDKTNKTWILKTTKISILSFKSPSNFTSVSPNSTECHNASLKSPFMNTVCLDIGHLREIPFKISEWLNPYCNRGKSKNETCYHYYQKQYSGCVL